MYRVTQRRSVVVALVFIIGALIYWRTAPAGTAPDRAAPSRADMAAPVPSTPAPPNPAAATLAAAIPSPQETAPASRSGSTAFLSEDAFYRRLAALGVEDPETFFDDIHGWDPTLGLLTVVVTDSDHRPVSGARVVVDIAQPKVVHEAGGRTTFTDGAVRAVTDKHGLAVLINTPASQCMVAASHPHFTPAYHASLAVPAGEETYLAVTLEDRAYVAGKVVDLEGQGVPGVAVESRHAIEGGIAFRSQGFSDDQGYFEISVLEHSSSQLDFHRAGYQAATLPNVMEGRTNLQVVLTPNETAAVRGHVTYGLTDDPVGEFRIDGQALSSRNGTFQVERNVAAEVQTLVVTSEGLRPGRVSFVLTSQDGLDIGRVALFGDAGLHGLVLDSGSIPAPVPGASVTLSPSASGDAQSVTTTEIGGFSFDPLRSGPWTLRVEAPGFSSHEQEIVLDEDESRFVEIQLRGGLFKAQGTITEQGAGPLSGVRVEVVGQEALFAVSDADGNFEVSDIPDSEFQLRATKSGYYSAKSELFSLQTTTPSADDTAGRVAIWNPELDAGGLRARLLEHGEPVGPGVEAVLWDPALGSVAGRLVAQSELPSHRRLATTDADGIVAFEVEPGAYFLQVPSFRLDPTRLVLEENRDQPFDIELPGHTELSGTITDASGQPVANTSLWLHSGDQNYSTMSLYHTDSQGRYTVPRLTGRPYALSIVKSIADQSAQHVRKVSVSGADDQTLNVQFPPLTSSIIGQLVDEFGQGRPGVQIGVEYLDAPHRSILAGWVGTDETGHFTVPRLEPGRHRVRTAWTAEQVVFSQELILVPGQQAEIELVAASIPGFHARGHLIAPDGGPLGGNFIYAVDALGRTSGNYFSTMDWAYAGSFDVGGLAAGDYTLVFTAMGCQERRVPVTVSADVSGMVVEMFREQP